jgi:hypothetical protein
MKGLHTFFGSKQRALSQTYEEAVLDHPGDGLER